MKVEYDSNNSGGSWWLSDKDWKALEAAGWDVHWIKNDDFYSEDTFLGTKAVSASIEVDEVRDAIKSFEKATGQDAGAIGCTCCGPPHSFSWKGGYVSGEGVYDYLFDKSCDHRSALEHLNR